MLKGEIFASEEDLESLEALGIFVGEYDYDERCFRDCIVTDEVFVILDRMWGRYFWDLREMEE